jgi:hypothetical protein
MLPQLVLPAHHVALLAIPAFGPAIVVVAVILFIAWRDRRDERQENETQAEGPNSEDHS